MFNEYSMRILLFLETPYVWLLWIDDFILNERNIFDIKLIVFQIANICTLYQLGKNIWGCYLSILTVCIVGPTPR